MQPENPVPESSVEGGAGEGTRTPDLVITNDALYQLSYTGCRLLHSNSETGLTGTTCLSGLLRLAFTRRVFKLRIGNDKGQHSDRGGMDAVGSTCLFPAQGIEAAALFA